MSVSPLKEFPVIFLSHAAPVLIMRNEHLFGQTNDVGIGTPANNWYRNLPKQLGLVNENKPKAILVVSAHWEGHGTAYVSSAAKPSLYYDYGGFPDYTYKVQYPCPGNPALANKVCKLLNASGISCTEDSRRGLDHASFIPLMLMYPDADIPVVQLSLFSDYDPIKHVKMGMAIRELRKEGVLIIASGQATHGAFGYNPSNDHKNRDFLRELTNGIKTTEPSITKKYGGAAKSGVELIKDQGYMTDFFNTKRVSTVVNWKSLPYYRVAHTTDDHFVPMCAAVGATRPEETMDIAGDYWLLKFHSLRTFVWGDYPNKGIKAVGTGATTGKDEL